MSAREAPRLPPAAEALLADWPAPERSEEAWETFAQGVMGRLENNEKADDSSLFEPPLPRTVEDENRERRSSPGFDKPSLAEMARAKLHGEDHSRDLVVAKESLKHVAQARHTGETAETVARAAEVAEVQRYREDRESAVPTRQGAGWRGAVIGAAGALVAAAAVFALFIYSNQPQSADTPAPSSPQVANETAGSSVPEVDPEDVAKLHDLPVDDEANAKPSLERPTRTTASQPRVAMADPAKADSPSKKKTDEPDEFDSKLPHANDSQVSKRPLRPTPGEAMAAVAPSVPRAQICVAGHSKQSNAIVAFGSSGQVESVTVSGPAAGTPAGECIKNALRGARVSPFTEPRFSMNVPIRPVGAK